MYRKRFLLFLKEGLPYSFSLSSQVPVVGQPEHPQSQLFLPPDFLIKVFARNKAARQTMITTIMVCIA
jgi:hypothetical protein